MFCTRLQVLALYLDWPSALLSLPACMPVYSGSSGTCSSIPAPGANVLLYRGLPLVMGVHYGHPVTEYNPALLRAEYSGVMVQDAARAQRRARDDECLVSRDVHDAIGYSADGVCDAAMDERATLVAIGAATATAVPALYVLTTQSLRLRAALAGAPRSVMLAPTPLPPPSPRSDGSGGGSGWGIFAVCEAWVPDGLPPRHAAAAARAVEGFAVLARRMASRCQGKSLQATGGCAVAAFRVPHMAALFGALLQHEALQQPSPDPDFFKAVNGHDGLEAQYVQPSGPARAVVWHGLRVRVGVHAGGDVRSAAQVRQPLCRPQDDGWLHSPPPNPSVHSTVVVAIALPMCGQTREGGGQTRTTAQPRTAMAWGT